MATTAKKKEQAEAQPEAALPVVVAYKGFGPNWKCRDFAYKVGETYSMDGPIAACDRGFHACEYPLDVLAYYPAAGSHFAIVEQSGDLSRHDSDTKIASSRIHVKAEIDFAGLIKAAVDWTFSRAKPVDPESPAHSAAECGHAAESGYSGAASATGDRGAASATGKASAAMASGCFGRAMAADGCALFLVERDDDWNIAAAWAGIAGRDGISPLVWYTLADGKPVAVEG